jgi:hypothetical protein
VRPPRTARPLPRYTLRKLLRSGVWAYFFNVPMWARTAGCPIANEPLGVEYNTVVERVENILLPAFDSWRAGGATQMPPSGPGAGTLDWVFAEYRTDRRFTKLDAKTRRNHEAGFRLVGSYTLKDGRRFGTLCTGIITTAVTDELYEKLLFVAEVDAAGNTIRRERRTTVNHAMKSCRRAWNIAARRNPGKLPAINPFAQMGLVSSNAETPTATFEELEAFRAKAIELGQPAIATGALIAYEFLQREEDVFGTFTVAHYRPKEHPDAVRVVDEKTRTEGWFPLFDANGVPHYPDLITELDALKADRVGIMLLRPDGRPWPSGVDSKRPGDLGTFRHKVKQIIRAAGLRDELSFRSFRHGGFTEAGNSGLTDAEIRAQGRHRSSKVLPKYVKRTMQQVAIGVRKRHAARTKREDLSE